MAPNQLIDHDADSVHSSERVLMDQQKSSDFDSAIPRFESWRPSQSTQRLSCHDRVPRLAYVDTMSAPDVISSVRIQLAQDEAVPGFRAG
jgi:hypothetical protein